MGLIQRFTNYMWLSGCDVWMTDYAPQYASTAKKLCGQFKEYLLEQKAAGKTPQEASCDICILILKGLSEGAGSWDLELVEFQKVAYSAGYGCLNKWPKVDIGDDYPVRLFRVMALLDVKIWQSPLAANMRDLLK